MASRRLLAVAGPAFIDTRLLRCRYARQALLSPCASRSPYVEADFKRVEQAEWLVRVAPVGFRLPTARATICRVRAPLKCNTAGPNRSLQMTAYGCT